MTKIQVKNVSKIIRKKDILKEISFTISSGEIIGLIGPNGAGKSTLLKLITGLIKPSLGEVLVNDTNIQNEFNKVANEIGFLIEEPSLYDRLNAIDNLKLCLKLHSKIDNKYLQYICKGLEINNFLNKKVKNYSMGMKQRLGIACSLIHNPNIIILDEPTNSLDINGIRQIRDLIRDIHDDNKIIIISSHILSEIEEICDRVLVLNNGLLVDDFKNDSIISKDNAFYIIQIESKGKEIDFIKNKAYIIDSDNSQYKIKVNKAELNMILDLIVKNGMTIVDIKVENSTLERHFIGRGDN
ncbi:ABC transporter ATP-binding protein [Clostridium sp. D2Q-14]|uniref:ABC transporter ATP-binding protein n=1 Tax=Anaeromonas gelatinilytica TaxID=2683194 RepID=UPI00193BDBA9|nr:ABC transporter ATP-binding protein [Anaeromonas gelatinilytica]MBS4534636.1 ABC transporter ATP-binding protein [Anaeromonas gelatinilytica]